MRTDISSDVPAGNPELNGIELMGDAEILRRLLLQFEPNAGQPRLERRKYKRRVRSAREIGPEDEAKTSARKRCTCGECVTCRDNARWDRIFNEKFADHDYYKPRSVTFRSPLHAA
jgi:hypothetical protein